MAIALTSLGSGSSTSGGTQALTLGSTIPSGALIVVCVSDTSSGVVGGSVADNGGVGNVYGAGAGTDLNALTTNGFVRIFYCWNSAGLASGKVITYTKAIAGSISLMSVFYATGVQTTSDPGYAITSASGSSIHPSVTSGTSITSGDLVLAVSSTKTSGTQTQDSTNGSYATPPVSPANPGSNNSLFGGSLLATTTKAYTYTPTTANSNPWGALMMGFSAAGGGPGITIHNLTMIGCGV